VIADPLHAVAVLLAGKYVEPDFGPIIDALGQFQGLMFLMIRRINAIDGLLLAVDGEVGMQFHHQISCRDGVGAVHLDLVVALRARECRHSGKREQDQAVKQ
jgi:hypothetical protein